MDGRPDGPRPLGDRLLRTSGGRVRLAWRLAVWVVALVALTVAFAPLLPGGVTGVAGPVLAAAVIAGWSALALDGRDPAALGFHLGRSAVREAALGLVLGAGVALAAVGAVALAGGVRWVSEAGTVAGWLAASVEALWLFALPAAAEEAVFRGYGLQALAESWGPWTALAGTSMGFGAVHLSNPGASWAGAANVAVAGLFLGLVYLRTGSLWWATTAHLGWNWAHGFVADLPVSGLELVDAPLLEARMRGPEWISGGAFGPEGSVLATAALAAASVWAWRTGRLEPSPALVGPGTDEARAPLALMHGPGARRGTGRDGDHETNGSR